MICLALDQNNFLVATGSPPCAAGSLVAITQSEYVISAASPWNLSLSEGGLVAAAVLGVWVSAYCIRSLVRVLNSGDNSGN